MRKESMQPADAQTAGAAPARGKRPYVKPTFKVIPMEAPKLLAASAASSDPLFVRICGGVDSNAILERIHPLANCEYLENGTLPELVKKDGHAAGIFIIVETSSFAYDYLSFDSDHFEEFFDKATFDNCIDITPSWAPQERHIEFSGTYDGRAFTGDMVFTNGSSC
ncbi:MAG: hypothetical protein IJ722_05330 [Alloprevotella sp.]|nr:hypothetical protein [Alloprevotella sp.]